MISQELLEQLEVAKKRGDLDTQIEVLRQLLSLVQQNGEVVGEIEVLRLLGNVYHEKDQLQKAHSYRVTAVQLAENNRSQCPPEEFMSVYCDLGRSFIEVHDWVNAEIHTQHAFELAQSLQNIRAKCICKINFELIYVNTGRKQEAFRLGEDVLREAEHLQDHYVQGLQHLNLANFFLHELKLNVSQRHAKQALAHAELSEDVQLRMRTQNILGKIFHRARLLTGRIEYSTEAENYLQQTVESARSLGNLSLEADAETEFANFWEYRHKLDKANVHYQRALELLEKIRSQLGYEKFQLTYFRSFQPIYEKFTEFLLRQTQSNLAFLSAEQLRSRLLLAL
ncbi:MAG: hypothetical protein JRD93_17495, partial [Deltaproteobacteria bacterium]|nr:hypothetical protein [Deltaproteobacteria bacterium]